MRSYAADSPRLLPGNLTSPATLCDWSAGSSFLRPLLPAFQNALYKWEVCPGCPPLPHSSPSFSRAKMSIYLEGKCKYGVCLDPGHMMGVQQEYNCEKEKHKNRFLLYIDGMVFLTGKGFPLAIDSEDPSSRSTRTLTQHKQAWTPELIANIPTGG